MKVAILANGETVQNYSKRLSHLPRKYDEVWCLNQIGTWKGLDVDKCFVMDDLKLRMPFYAGYEFCEWLKTYDKPIITSKAYPEWPTSEDYPIREIAKYFGIPLGISMYSTPDYMIALAIYIGATGIDLFGVDMRSSTMSLEMRASTAQWIGAAHARGVLVRTFVGSWFQYFTNPGVAMECGLYGYAQRPRIEDLVNQDYYQEWIDAREGKGYEVE
jgi:hypothetical protein